MMGISLCTFSVEWNPKWFLNALINIYLALDSKALVNAMANDDSFSIDVMNRVQELMVNKLGHLETSVAAFRKMVQQVAELQAEIQEAFQNPPEEFVDPLMGSLMEQPVRLPSSNKVSREVLTILTYP